MSGVSLIMPSSEEQGSNSHRGCQTADTKWISNGVQVVRFSWLGLPLLPLPITLGATSGATRNRRGAVCLARQKQIR